MTQIFNRREGRDKRQVLRNSETQAEGFLWERLRNRQLAGRKFRRQFGVGIYVLDFYCPACRIAVEVDGPTHATEEAREYDAIRTRYLANLGITVLRFRNTEVYNDMEHVIRAIEKATAATNPLLSEGEGGKPEQAG